MLTGLVQREYTWPGVRTYIKEYIKSCTACARAKTPRHRPYGMLKQLPIPEQPWNSISMDFIEQLPASSGFTAILVVVDCLSKQVLFIPTHDTITSPELTQLFLLHCHDCDIPPQPSHIYSCPLAVQTSPKHSLTKPKPIPGLPDPSIAFPNSSAAFPKGCCTDVCLVSIPEAVNIIPEHI